MNKIQTFEEFITTQSVQVPLLAFIVNLLLACLLAFILSKVYTRFGNSLSNRRGFANNFILLTATTMLIISIVKSSLALSLGLVGALSIVRFRAAIKEPEELAYLFLAISIGLGFGADQRVITIAAFILITGIMVLKNLSKAKKEHTNLYLSISSHKTKISIEDLIKILRQNCVAVDLRRFDEGRDAMEASFLVEFDSFEKLEKTRQALQEIDKSITISFLDNKNLFSN